MRKPQRTISEQQICVMKGSETFKMVSPIYRKNIYVGAFQDLPKYVSPVDFFAVDQEAYPLAKDGIFVTAKLEAGDCMYIPSYYYVQS